MSDLDFSDEARLKIKSRDWKDKSIHPKVPGWYVVSYGWEMEEGNWHEARYFDGAAWDTDSGRWADWIGVSEDEPYSMEDAGEIAEWLNA